MTTMTTTIAVIVRLEFCGAESIASGTWEPVSTEPLGDFQHLVRDSRPRPLAGAADNARQSYRNSRGFGD